MENATHWNEMVPLILLQQRRLIINVFQEQKLFIAKEIKKVRGIEIFEKYKNNSHF
jgi:hypothetical protein